MSKRSYFYLLILALLPYCQSTAQPNKALQRVTDPGDLDFAAIFDSFGVTGTFVLHELAGNRTTIYNEQRAKKAFIPASTYKIPHTLIALQTGAVKDTGEVFQWDGTQRFAEAWNQDQTLASALRVSAVWVYQIIAQRIGPERMQDWLNRIDYGNKDLSGVSIDQFWLTGKLAISAEQQIRFLKDLYLTQLPFDPIYQEKVKALLVLEQTPAYRFCGKTGWADHPDPDIGWFVGWLETTDNTYLFALNIDFEDSEKSKARKAIARVVFQSLGLMDR